ncbi:SpoIID/LytB domain-containing protein [Bacillus sp. JJ1521]|uniref:SpoIID/LytB domain-containing protein n=1 Tax=Bacillus sp. JJ1521 TaxID=3122957 RepID=UPI002FFDBAD1
MNIKKISLAIAVSACLALSPLGSAVAGASTISVSLSNYIGNSTAVNVQTVGNYKLQNGNIRFGGKDRFEVANNVASSGWNTSNTVVIVNYLAFADALSATPLAYKNNAPILLTHPNQLTPATNAKLSQLKPQKIIIVGGPGSVSSTVEGQLKKITSNVQRIGGNDRYAVAQGVASQMGNPDTAFVANGLVFADALSIAPYAAQKGYPILLSKKDNLPNETKAALNGKAKTVVIGGEGSVSPQVYSSLGTSQKERIGGKDRYEVSANIIRHFNLPANSAFISTGLSFADALTGSVLAAKEGAPLLLTKPNELPGFIQTIIKEKGTSSFTILGGTGSVSEKVVGMLPNEVNLAPGVNYSVRVENARLALYNGNTRLKDFGTAPFTLIPSAYSGSNQIKINNVSYIGNMEFNLDGGKYVRPINRNIPYEDYLKGVVPREMPASWHVEALKAQAVAARTYSIDDVGKTVPDNQSYQVYGGYTWGLKDAYPFEHRSSQAVDATKGQVLRHNGKLISAVFSSSNGGMTESNANEWNSTALPYLPVKADSYDTYTWNLTVNKKQFNVEGKDLKNPGYWWWDGPSNLVDGYDLNGKPINDTIFQNLNNWVKTYGYQNEDIKVINISNIAVTGDKHSSGRSKTAVLKVDFYVYPGATSAYPLNGGEIQLRTLEKQIPATELRKLLGTLNMRSTLVDNIQVDDNAFKISGRGFGHGVGMSQQGANSRANAGQTYQQILQFYYPGTTLGN